jgi:hypothetical protein
MGSKNRLWLKIGIAAIILFLLDQGARNLELNSMVTKIQKSESQMINYNEDVAYWYKLYSSEDKSFDSTERQIARLAGENAPLIAAFGAQVESVYVFPWHRAIIRAKQDYLKHNDAWVSSLNERTVIDEKFGDSRLSQEIDNTFEISKFSLPEAVPMLDVFSLEVKIKDIFED